MERLNKDISQTRDNRFSKNTRFVSGLEILSRIERQPKLIGYSAMLDHLVKHFFYFLSSIDSRHRTDESFIDSFVWGQTMFLFFHAVICGF